ncbi:MAG: hypothetical protein COB58_06270 [Thalassobium sp.]|jgi:hypothetical protein|nr:MAG: hypothetical protein COB43_04915 [Oceanospirillales bacterium]PHQ87118.1 MAG: hypothetical protein COB58_06270 [Thalassobium sp.]
MKIINIVIALLGSLFLTSCASDAANSQVQSARTIAQAATNSVVLIKAYKDSSFTQQGSGFVVRGDGLIATNRHVIEDADSLEIHLANGEIYDRVFFVEDDQRRDLALLRIPANNLSALAIADEGDLSIGDPIFVIGNPMGLQGTLSNGIVSAKRIVEGISIIQITAPISPGSSGGPVLNERGEVVGIATLSLLEAQNINMAVPARYIDGLISIDSAPQLFQDVAHLLSGSQESTDDVFDNLEPWAQVLVSEIAAVQTSVQEYGLESTHEVFYDFAKQGELFSVEFTYDESDVEKDIFLVAVCDSDCSDIDLAAADPDGELLNIDEEENARAVITFTIEKSGIYTVGVLMPNCDTESCGFAIQSFAK